MADADAADMGAMADEMDAMLDEEDMMDMDDMMMDDDMKKDDKMMSESLSDNESEEDLEFDVLLKRDMNYSCCFQINLVIIAVCTGLLQGYQIGLIAGTELFLGEEMKGISIGDDSDGAEASTQDREFFVSFFSLGAAFGSLFGSQIADFVGRKWAIVIAVGFTAIGFIIIAVAPSIMIGFLGRFIAGIGQGIMSFAISLYLNEVGTSSYNKIISAVFTIFQGGGMIGGLNVAIPFRHHWRILYWFGLVPCGALILFIVFMPESQNFLVAQNRDEEALVVLKMGLTVTDAELELKKLKFEKRFYNSDKIQCADKCSDLMTVYTWPFFMSLILASFSQLVGTSAFLYYGPEILKDTNIDFDDLEQNEAADIVDNFLIGAFVLGNLISAFMIYKVGRRWIVLTALPFAVVAGGVLSYTMYEANYGDSDEVDNEVQQEYRHFDRETFIAFIIIYLLAISIGLSNTIWGMTSEITPNYLLAQSSGLVCTWGWLINFAVNSVFLTILNDQEGKWVIFIVLACIAFLAYLFVFFLVPETIFQNTKENLEMIIGKEKLAEARRRVRKDHGVKDPYFNSKSKVIQETAKLQQESGRFQSQY